MLAMWNFNETQEKCHASPLSLTFALARALPLIIINFSVYRTTSNNKRQKSGNENYYIFCGEEKSEKGGDRTHAE